MFKKEGVTLHKTNTPQRLENQKTNMPQPLEKKKSTQNCPFEGDIFLRGVP